MARHATADQKKASKTSRSGVTAVYNLVRSRHAEITPQYGRDLSKLDSIDCPNVTIERPKTKISPSASKSESTAVRTKSEKPTLKNTKIAKTTKGAN